MTERVLLAALLPVAYLVTFAVGSVLHPIGVTRTLGSHGLTVRLYVWDGVLLMLALFLLTLAIEALGRRLWDLAPWTMGSLARAALLGYLRGLVL